MYAACAACASEKHQSEFRRQHQRQQRQPGSYSLTQWIRIASGCHNQMGNAPVRSTLNLVALEFYVEASSGSVTLPSRASREIGQFV